MGSSRQGTSARLPPCPSQNRTSGFPSIRLFSIDSDQQRPICVRSLGIRFPPLKMGNVLLTRSSMLWRPSLHRHYPTSFAIPASIPRSWSFASLPFWVALAYSYRFCTVEEPSDPPGSSSVSMCCSMPSATPGKSSITRLTAISLVACFSCESFGLPNFGSFGAIYRIQLLSLHLATSLRSLLRIGVV